MSNASSGVLHVCFTGFFSSLFSVLARRRKLGINHFKYHLVGILFSLAVLVFSSLTASASLLFSADYDNGSFGPVQYCSGSACPSGFPSMPTVAARTLVTRPTRHGTRAVKVALLPNFTNCHYYYAPVWGANCYRAEFETGAGVGRVGDERWYGLSIYIDPAYLDTSNDWNGAVIAQWHDTRDPCDITKSPHLMISITRDMRLRVRNQSDPNPCTKNINVGRVDYDIGSVAKGVWVDFVVHAKWSYTSSGVLEVWRNGVKVINKWGPNTYNDKNPQNWKWGIYKSWWTVQPPPARDKYIVYFDNVKIGDAGSRYTEVAP